MEDDEGEFPQEEEEEGLEVQFADDFGDGEPQNVCLFQFSFVKVVFVLPSEWCPWNACLP